MHHHLLLKNIALFDSHLCRARWLRFFNVDDPAHAILANSAPTVLQLFTKKIATQPNLFLFVVQLQRRKSYSKLLHKTYKYSPRAKKPPTAARAGRLTQFRGSRPSSSTSVIFLFSQQSTNPQNIVLIDFYSNWLNGHDRRYMLKFGQTMARLPAAKITHPTATRGSAARMPKNFVGQWAPPPYNFLD